jgi:hypothetical protein
MDSSRRTDLQRPYTPSFDSACDVRLLLCMFLALPTWNRKRSNMNGKPETNPVASAACGGLRNTVNQLAAERYAQ